MIYHGPRPGTAMLAVCDIANKADFAASTKVGGGVTLTNCLLQISSAVCYYLSINFNCIKIIIFSLVNSYLIGLINCHHGTAVDKVMFYAIKKINVKWINL